MTQSIRLHDNEHVDFHRLTVGDTVTVRRGMMTPTDMNAEVIWLRRNARLDSGEYQLVMEVEVDDGTRNEIKRWVKPDEQ